MLKYLNLVWLFFRIKKEFITPTKKPILLIYKFFFANLNHNTFNSKTMLAIYDLNNNGITYNFAEFIVLCNLEIKKKNLNSYKIIFINKDYKSFEFKILKNKQYYLEENENIQNKRVENILIPLTKLENNKCNEYKFINNIKELDENLSEHHVFPNNYNSFYKPVHNVYELFKQRDLNNICLNANQKNLIDVKKIINKLNFKIDKLVTITIRDQKYDIVRNSDTISWIKYYKFLIDKGYEVVFLPDTENINNLDDKLENKRILKNISINLHLRIALYEISHFNYFTSGGPSALCYLNPKTSFCIFNHGPIENSMVNKANSFSYMEKNKPYNFMDTTKQFLKWQKDDYDNLVNSFYDNLVNL